MEEEIKSIDLSQSFNIDSMDLEDVLLQIQ